MSPYGLGAGHRRDQMIDDRGVRAPFGLGALARIVDQEGIDQRQRADARRRCRSRPTCRGSCPAATPGCRACRDGRPRARRTPSRASGTSPGSGGSEQDQDRGRSRSGSRRSRAAAGPRSRRCRPAAWRPRSRRPASRVRSTNSSPGASPQAAVTATRQDRSGSSASQRRYVAAGIRTGCPASCSLGQPLRVLAAGRDQRVDQGVAGRRVGLLALDSAPAARCRGSRRARRGRSRPRASPAAAGSPRPACPGRPRCRSGSASSDRPTARSRSGARPAGCAGAGRG